MTMTSFQAECLAYIQFLLAGELKSLASLYTPSGVCAHIEIESSWKPDIGDDVDQYGSAGLMQCLPATAASMGVHGNQRNPANSILAGMKYLDNCRQILGSYRTKAGGRLQITDVVAAYNEGPGNVMHGRQDPHYVDVWTVAQKKWAYVDALPMDPKAAAALVAWQGAGMPPAIGASVVKDEPNAPPSPSPVSEEPKQTEPAHEHQGDSGAAPEPQDGAEDLNGAELETLKGQTPEQAAQAPTDQGNASLDGA